MHNPYQTISVMIKNVKDEGSNSKLFIIERPRGFDFVSGQFVIVSLPGVGEAPISICSDPNEKKTFELGARKVGKVTEAFHGLKKGDRGGIRGPYGHGFPLGLAGQRNLLIVGGGVGLEPLRPAIKEIVKNRKKYKKVQIFYGAKAENDLLFQSEYDSWMMKDIDFNLCLEKPSGKFKL